MPGGLVSLTAQTRHPPPLLLPPPSQGRGDRCTRFLAFTWYAMALEMLVLTGTVLAWVHSYVHRYGACAAAAGRSAGIGLCGASGAACPAAHRLRLLACHPALAASPPPQLQGLPVGAGHGGHLRLRHLLQLGVPGLGLVHGEAGRGEAGGEERMGMHGGRLDGRPAPAAGQPARVPSWAAPHLCRCHAPRTHTRPMPCFPLLQGATHNSLVACLYGFAILASTNYLLMFFGDALVSRIIHPWAAVP